ncbi:hypothetical protein CK203_030202 [Vitis vinifera]|uniref:Aspartic peptidase DDI1-type domain-containing protein n=1 Tax=Vitis vinifera TaxID=29760 RepID=A0A438I565_VITVI|nr:hypothetical protein CK203_030202 [Vitis vinifera]
MGEKKSEKDGHDSNVDEEPRIVIKEDMMKKHMPPPFPQALHGKKETKNTLEIFEVLRQVKVNIPLLDMIKQVLTYAKFLKDLCTIKRWLNVNKKAFLIEQVSAIIQCKSPVKFKDLGCPTISANIGGTCVEKALLDLGTRVNLLPYSVYKQLGLGELKPTSITLSLADRSVKIPRGIIEDVLGQTMCQSYLEDHSSLLRMQSSIHLHQEEEEEPKEVCMIDTLVEEHCEQSMEEDLIESLRDLDEGLLEPSNLLTTMSHWRRREEILPLFNEEESHKAAKKESPKPTLKLLPTGLKYAYLKEDEQCPVAISLDLSSHQEDGLIGILRRCKKAIGWKFQT